MDHLSPEITALIATHLCTVPRTPFPVLGAPRISRAPYAVLSRRWQSVVEPWTLSSIKLKDTELDTFAAIFAATRRRALLRHLNYNVSLPTYGDSRYGFAQNQAALENSILKLLDILKDWDNVSARLELQIVVEWDIDTSQGPIDFGFNVLNSSSSRRYLMLDAVELPTVQCVASLHILASPGRALHPTTMCQLAGTLPQLGKLELEVLDPANKRRQMRKEHRLALAAGLTTLKLPKLTHLSIHRKTTIDVYNHSFECSDLEEDGFDALNDALRKLSQTAPLTDLVLTGALVSPDLFRSRCTTDLDSSIWPTLRNFSVKADIIAPSGLWYYTGVPDAMELATGSDYGDEDEDEDEDSESSDSDDNVDRDAVANGVRPSHVWRTRPDPDLFNTLVQDMAGAVLRMPQLRTGTLDIGPRYGELVDIILKCAEATCAFDDRPDGRWDEDEEKSTRRWHTWVGSATEWEMPEDVRALWARWLGDSGRYAVGRWPPAGPGV
ncbi:uncharacterized protein GGS22DRAFT_196418 [Annulohypoxylon maeteangense]|uniref:uncharacterized protein n=1 Tax=Annulohypoxylon maeteangense TaxID=1927788 RepID=UPI0020081D08|nr:uncharacterized protein GGS22DRAFT_196418 [Annulohypoxylon maeteangense]KAI0881466.1 hypothetical protein GGS22DRAFT_196418 [Annulohypoxylon maeteangense]